MAVRRAGSVGPLVAARSAVGSASPAAAGERACSAVRRSVAAPTAKRSSSSPTYLLYLLKKTWCAVSVASVDDTVLAVLTNPDPTRPVSSALSVVRIAVAVVLYDSM